MRVAGLLILAVTLLIPSTLYADAAEAAFKFPSQELLGPFPILQFFAALIALVVTALGGFVWIKGKAAGELSAPRNNEAAVQLFFDGPLRAIFDSLTGIHSAQAMATSQLREALMPLILENRKYFSDEIYDTKAEIKEEISRMHNENKERLNDINDLLVRMDERDKQRKKGD